MNPKLLDILACPRDGAFPLQLGGEVSWLDGEVVAGSLICPKCDTSYPLVEGIPDLLYLGANDMTAATKKAEIESRDTEAQENIETFYTNYQTSVEVSAILRRLESSGMSRILELGCGAGRISQFLLSRCDDFVGIDFSMDSLRKFRTRIKKRTGFDLIRADLNHLPLRLEPAFDYIVCAQVFEHLPSQHLRRNFLVNCQPLLNQDGCLILTTYNLNLARRLKKVSKEGYHRSGIYYYCYDATELRRELTEFYHLEELSGIRNLPVWVPRHLGEAAGRWLDRLVARIGLDRTFGDLLLIVGYRLADKVH